MCRYVIAFILINIYYPSTGHPLHENATHMSIANRLQNLANMCDNSIISELITKQIQLCNVSESADTKTEFKCLMFFDINSQLCTAFRRSKFNLKDSYATKMNQIQDIKTTCNHASTWQFTNKEIYPKNEPVDQVFKNEIFCIQMCSVDQFLSADSNFFCKYYQWGTEVIQSQAALTQQNSGAPFPVLVESNLNPIGNNTEITNVQKSENSTTSTSESIVKPIETKLDVPKDEFKKTEISNPDLSGQTSTANQLTGGNIVQKPQELANAPKITDQPVVSNPETASKNEIEKPPVEEEPPKKDEVEKDTSVQKESVIENPKVKQPVADIDEDQEDENEDDAEYVQGSDQDDAAIKPMESDPNIDIKKPKNSLSAIVMPDQNAFNALLDSESNIGVQVHKSRAGIESMTSVSETFPNSMQDSFEEDDDHFFPFFVTAIIIVVLLYILYHNKNKFTKVILGLLVEGRQTGRRRNSRGHAYRRLDTLEQAMNTNTAAPPSKIIY